MTIATSVKRAGVKRAAGIGALAALALGAAAEGAAAEGYLRFGAGYDWSQRTVFADIDCTVTGGPWSLFGCGPGIDGRPLGAYGSFGGSPAFEIAIGTYASPALRFELAASLRNGFVFDGEANFTGTTGDQLVTAMLSEAALMGWAIVDLGAAHGASWPVEPFIGFGVGVSRNVLSPMEYDFPGMPQPSWSITPGGTRTGFAYGFVAGLARELSHGVTLELAYRHVNYGLAATDFGDLVSQRGGPPFVLEILETRAPLVTNSVMVSVRWAVGG